MERSQSHLDSRCGELLLDSPDGYEAVVQDRCDEHSVCGAMRRGDQVLGGRRAARRDDGDGCYARRGRDQIEVVAGTGAVAIPAREEDFPRAAAGDCRNPGNCVSSGTSRTGVCDDFPAIANAGGVDCDDDALATEGRARSSINSGVATAAVFTPTLSAPADSSVKASSTFRTPPPTVNGMLSPAAHGPNRVARAWRGPRVSRKRREARVRQLRRAGSGSASGRIPTSRRPEKRTPLTTRPLRQSKHGMTVVSAWHSMVV